MRLRPLCRPRAPFRALLFLLSASVVTSAGAVDFFQPVGPPGGSIQHIVQVENGDLFVIAAGSVHRSTNIGQSWGAVSPVPGTSSKLAAGPGNRLYALGGALYVSTDDGASWLQVSNAPNPCRVLATDTAGRLFAAAQSGLYRSDDLGATWTKVAAVPIGAVAAAPDGSLWYSSGKNLSHLDASGASLPGTVIESGEYSSGITALAARWGGGVYAGTGPNHLPVPYGGGVYRIESNLTMSNIGLGSQYLLCIVTRPDDTLFVGSSGFCYEGCTGGGVYVGSSTGGFTCHTPGMAVTGLVDAQGTVLASTTGIDGSGPPPEYSDIAIPPSGVLRSQDNGATWQLCSVGLPFSRVYSVRASAAGLLIASSDWWVYRSTDRGNSWTPMASPGSYGFDLLLAATADVVYAVRWYWAYRAATGFYRAATDGSGAWTVHSLPYGTSALDVTAQGTLLAVEYAGQDLARSEDQGNSWTTQNNILPPSLWARFAIGRYRRVALLTSPNAATLLSENDGRTWTTIGNRAGVGAFSPDETVLYIAQSNQVLALDEGLDWAETPTPPITSVQDLAVDPAGAVYVATASGVYRWESGDAAWLSVGPSIAGAFNGRAGWYPQVQASRDGFLYATTWNAGVWRGDSGVTDAPWPETDAITLLGASPSPFRGSTTIGFELGRPQTVRLTLFDVRGRRIASLLEGKPLRAGTHRATWRPAADTPRGVYLYELRLGSSTRAGRVVLR